VYADLKKKGLKDKPFTIVNSKFEAKFYTVTFRQNVYPLYENKPNGPKIDNKCALIGTKI
jgi:hypothetical protein